MTLSEAMERASSPIAVAVVVHAGCVLVGRRSMDAAESPGLAEFPGGKVEPHETSADAAARECLEEAGIAVHIGERSLAVTAPLSIRFHWAIPLDPRAMPRAPFEWVPLERLSQLNFPAANTTVLEALREGNATAGHGGS